VSGPTIVSEQAKAQALLLGHFFDQAAEAFEYASVAASGTSGLAKNIVQTTVLKVLKVAIAQNDQIFGQQIELSAAALVSNVIAADPPDPNFTIVALPRQLSFPPTGNGTVDMVLADYMTYISLSAATLHAAERWQGALIGGDQTSLALQAAAYGTYSEQSTSAKAILATDNALLLGVLPRFTPPLFFSARQEDLNKENAVATAYAAQCGQPLPSDLNASLLTLGLSQATIDVMTCDAVSDITPLNMRTDFQRILMTTLP
jgi:hypothetical protein